MANLQGSMGSENNQVLFEETLYVKKVILNRPRKLNSFNFEMLSQISKKLKEYENDSTVKLVILKGNGKAFCAGGDLPTVYKYATKGHWSFLATFFKKYLTLSYLLATYKKPLVALMDGIVLGGGAGLSMYARFKIVTEKTVFALPEASIGLCANGAIPHILCRIPGYFGEYLGLTGAHLNGAQMVACGLATHFVLSKDLKSLENELEKVASSDTTAISELISHFVEDESVRRENIAHNNRLKIVNECFSRDTVENILLALEKQAEKCDEKWIVDAINSIKSTCPTSHKICLRSIREDEIKSLEECIIREYNVSSHNVRRTMSNDFYEGVRTMVFHKDQKPQWQPSMLELVTEEMIDRYFSKVEDDDWESLQLPHRSNFVYAVKSKL